MSDVATLPDPIAEIEATGAITAADVLTLRQEIFGDGAVDAAEAAAIFRLDQQALEKAPVWAEFYVDSLTDHFVWKSDPPKYVSEEQAQFLIDQITHDGKIDGLTELELLVNIVHWSVSCPESLVALVLEAVKESVLAPDDALFGRGRNAGVVTAADVHLLRRAIYAGGSGGGYTVTRREAELVFDINSATVASENDRSWRDLFIKAIANHLMFPSGAPEVPSVEEYKRREAWLEERRGVGNLLAEVGKNVITLNADFAGTLSELDLFGRRESTARKAQEDAQLREALSRESIDESEAHWLLNRIAEGGAVDENIRALLRFIRDESPHIDPLLDDLFQQSSL